MIIRYASDLHLEAYEGLSAERKVEIFIPRDERDEGAVLVLAGDISSKPASLADFMRVIRPRFREIVYVPGNHESYGQQILENEVARKKFCQDLGIHTPGLFSVITVQIDDVDFICGTLWGDGGKHPLDSVAISLSLADFRAIRVDDGVFTVHQMMEIHRKQKAQIEAAIAASEMAGRRQVVVTHHLPSRELVHERYLVPGGDGINGGFVGDCSDILYHGPDIWIFGHTHDTTIKKIGRTLCLCNPAGYRSEYVTPFNQFMQVEGGQVVSKGVFTEI